MRPKRVLVVDDSAPMAELVAEALSESGFEAVTANDGAGALRTARLSQPDVVVTDLRMAGMDGFDVLAQLRALDPEVPVLIMTAFGSIDSAVEAMQRGAWTYLTKPFRMDELVLHVTRAAEERGLRDENRALRRVVAAAAPAGMVGHSRAMATVFDRIARLADAEVPVLIRGESGTGKELVARALHEGGQRRERPFVAVNCASVPASLLESELFGHVKGAFTGATGPRRGLFLEADGGTVFLDEIGDMPLELQAHLLRVLEDRVVRAVGADQGRKVDVRILAATHQDLEARVEQGRFRADLFYRLDVVPLRLPPLRERSGDIADLATTFLARAANPRVTGFAPEALAALVRYRWPGNVRELENVVRRLALLAEHALIDTSDLQANVPAVLGVAATEPAAPFGASGPLRALREVENDYIAWAVEQCGGNKTRAAEALGIDVSTIHRRVRAS